MFFLFILLIFMTIISNFLMSMTNFKIYFSNKFEVECGMYSNFNNNCSSSLYLMFLIIFLIFDLEIILIFLLLLKNVNIMMMIFLMFILFSLIIELFDNSLKWND